MKSVQPEQPSESKGLVTPNADQIKAFAEWMPTLGQVQPFSFHGIPELFPAVGQSGTLESFFLNAAHQFGFWTSQDGRYDQPMIATVDGVARKGSDYLFYCFQRALNADPEVFLPHRLAEMSVSELDRLFHDDTGRNPLPMWDEHAELIRAYASWFVERNQTPADLLALANASERPLQTFLELVGQVPGYAEDPLRKKLMLLAVILENRPEKFLHVSDPESAVPIIDYHLQRSALRTGLVDVQDAALRDKLIAREEVSADAEEAVRTATYAAIADLVEQSGLSVAAVDYFFFTNRTRCPEMTEPKCAECPVQTICKQRKELFQPVFRTTAY